MKHNVYVMNHLNPISMPASIDSFIFFSTLEDRSWNVIDYLSSKNKLPSTIMAIKLNDEKMPALSQKAQFKTTKFEMSTIETDLSSSIISCLRDIHNYVSDKEVVGIDISVMPTPVFAQILHFFLKKHKEKKVIVYYTEPEHYNLDNLFDFTSLNGEIEIKAIPGFEGKTAQKNEQQRIIYYLLGFEMNYLNRLIPQETNPDMIVPINGFPSYFPKYKDISLINNNVNYHEQDIPIVFAAANNPFETFNQLCVLKNNHANYCIDIIPTGTKPMALGACLFALKSYANDIRILFPFPTEYIKHHSIGKGLIWEYQL